MKERATLLMALPNKDQLNFHSYQDAKLLMEAIEKRCVGNKESKKVQRTLLKQQYENFAALSYETIDQTFDSTNNTNSTNKADDTAYEVSTTHTKGKKLDINGQRIGFDKSKVECFNCHKHGHFARECRFPRNQDYKGRENDTRTIAVETPTQNALIAQDGIGGYDWSNQLKKKQPK
ncbi:ribonuclease H-like domain-containing protein [Tanacetum coccineum]|uniref:Ribonuclease H-like domain-containing protein n=1 Tax=Tanacetum coccineum TaxID=301880 RepID=A0ABQ5HP53_9ASTR